MIVFLLQLDIHITFDGDKEFEQKIILWGVSTKIHASQNLFYMYNIMLTMNIPSLDVIQ